MEARPVRYRWVVSPNHVKCYRCFIVQYILPSLFSTGSFQERIQVWFHNWTNMNWGPYDSLIHVKKAPRLIITSTQEHISPEFKVKKTLNWALWQTHCHSSLLFQLKPSSVSWMWKCRYLLALSVHSAANDSVNSKTQIQSRQPHMEKNMSDSRCTISRFVFRHKTSNWKFSWYVLYSNLLISDIKDALISVCIIKEIFGWI